MPLVSVVMAAYNAENTIADAIKSVQNQNYRAWELLIIDDKSTDNTLNIVRECAATDSRIRLFENSTNSGSPAKPRNTGLENAKGRYIALLDSDDLWHREKLSRQISFMQQNSAFITCTGYEIVDKCRNLVGEFIPPSSATYEDLLQHNSIGCLTVIFDREQFGQHKFPVCGHEDYAVWLSLLRDGGEVLGLPDKLATYNLRPGSISSNKVKVAQYYWHIYRNREKFSLYQSAFMILRYALLNRNKYSLRAD